MCTLFVTRYIFSLLLTHIYLHGHKKFTTCNVNAHFAPYTDQKFESGNKHKLLTNASNFEITHVCDHISRGKNSHIYKHLISSISCKKVSSKNCFIILDTPKYSYQIKLKEALHIN